MLALKIVSLFSWFLVGFTMVMFTPAVGLGFLFDPSGNISHNIIRVWSRMVLFFARGNLCVHGQENLDPQKIYVLASNHEGNGDIPALFCALPMQFKWAAKKELFQIPFFGWDMQFARYIPIDRTGCRDNGKTILQRISMQMKKGHSILMFPEGTRSKNGEMGQFKSGTFRLAIQSQNDIVPIAIFGSRRGLPAKNWVIHGGKVIVNIGPPIPVKGLQETKNNIQFLSDLCKEKITSLRDQAQRIDEAEVLIPSLLTRALNRLQ